MNNTIQTRSYSSHEAVLLQQRPSDIIEAAETVVDTPETLNQHVVQIIYGGGQSRVLNSSVISAGRGKTLPEVVLTASAKVYLLSLSRPTTSPDSLVDSEEFVAQDGWTRWVAETKGLLQRAAASVRRSPTAAAHLRMNRLAVLQTAFGFTTQDLAEVLGISRQQLYKWLDVTKEVKLNEASRVRLTAIERVAKAWTMRSATPLGSVSREPVANERTVFEMLTANVVDEAIIVGALDELVVKLQSKPKTRSQRLRDAGFTRRVSTLPSDE